MTSQPNIHGVQDRDASLHGANPDSARHGCSRVSDADLVHARDMLRTMSWDEVARRYGVSKQALQSRLPEMRLDSRPDLDGTRIDEARELLRSMGKADAARRLWVSLESLVEFFPDEVEGGRFTPEMIAEARAMLENSSWSEIGARFGAPITTMMTVLPGGRTVRRARVSRAVIAQIRSLLPNHTAAAVARYLGVSDDTVALHGHDIDPGDLTLHADGTSTPRHGLDGNTLARIEAHLRDHNIHSVAQYYGLSVSRIKTALPHAKPGRHRLMADGSTVFKNPPGFQRAKAALKHDLPKDRLIDAVKLLRRHSFASVARYFDIPKSSLQRQLPHVLGGQHRLKPEEAGKYLADVPAGPRIVKQPRKAETRKRLPYRVRTLDPDRLAEARAHLEQHNLYSVACFYGMPSASLQRQLPDVVPGPHRLMSDGTTRRCNPRKNGSGRG